MHYRRQHIVPRMVLDNFKDQNGHVWTYDKAGTEPRHAIPEETAIIAHFYSWEREDGSMDASLEETINKLESEAKKPYEKMLSGEMVTGDDKAIMASFLGLMVVRTTTYRRLAAKSYTLMTGVHLAATATIPGAFEAMVRKLEERDGQKLAPGYIKHLRTTMRDLDGYELSVPKEFVLSTISHGHQYAEVFERMKWSLLKPESGYFVTSDNPVYRAADPRTAHPILGDHGFLNKTAQVTFPLSPQMMLLMTWEGQYPRVAPLERLYVDALNGNRAAGAEQYLYAHIADKRVARLAAQHKDRRPDIGGGEFDGAKGFGSFKVPRRRQRERRKT